MEHEKFLADLSFRMPTWESLGVILSCDRDKAKQWFYRAVIVEDDLYFWV